MLGWDPLREPDGPTLFNFAELDARRMKDDLLGSMPGELFGLAAQGPITVNAIHNVLANRTAARFVDLNEIVLRLFREGEFNILSPEGKRRTRALQHLRPSDLLTFPETPLLPLFSRVKRR